MPFKTMIDDSLKNRPFLYWNKRGKATVIVDNREAKKLIAEGKLWGVKCDDETRPGIYNPVYDVGDGNIPEQSSTPATTSSTHVLIDTLEGYEI